MKIITESIKYFMYITTAIIIICALNITLSGNDTMSSNTLWQIIISGAATAVVTAIVYSREVSTTKGFITMMAVHYVILCVVMTFLGVMFGWMKLCIPGIIMMVISVALVYVITFLSRYLLDKKQADLFNETLKNKYRD